MPAAPRVAPADAYLDDRALEVRQLQRRAVCSLIAIGDVLAEVKKVIGRGQFIAWLDRAELTRTAAYRLMAVAKHLGPYRLAELSQVGTMSPCAAYALAAAGVPDAARAYACQVVSDGGRVGYLDAIEIVRAHRDPKIAAKDVPALAPLRKEDRAAHAEATPDPDALSPSWQAVVAIAGSGGTLHLWHGGSDDGDGDHARGPAFVCGTAYPPEGKPRHAVRADLAELVQALAGTTPKKHCKVCLAVKPADEFYRNATRPDGRVDICKPCDKVRTGRYKGGNSRPLATLASSTPA